MSCTSQYGCCGNRNVQNCTGVGAPIYSWGGGEEEQCLTFTDGCCSTFPIFWPPRPDITPEMICRECGCKYIMYQFLDDCFPPTPDFSEVRKHGFEVEICQPNACNEIYFKFNANRCIPPRVCCSCPICRRRRRHGDHFRNCTCILCNSQRAKCLNRLRREMLAKHSKRCTCCGKMVPQVPPCCIPPPDCCDETEQSVEGRKCTEGDKECEDLMGQTQTEKRRMTKGLLTIPRNDETLPGPNVTDISGTQSKKSIMTIGSKYSVVTWGEPPPPPRSKESKPGVDKSGQKKNAKGKASVTNSESLKNAKSAEPEPEKATGYLKVTSEKIVPKYTCPCHLYMPSYWELKESCQTRQDYEEEKLLILMQTEREAMTEREKQRSGVMKYLSNSLSQLTWPWPPLCPEDYETLNPTQESFVGKTEGTGNEGDEAGQTGKRGKKNEEGKAAEEGYAGNSGSSDEGSSSSSGSGSGSDGGE